MGTVIGMINTIKYFETSFGYVGVISDLHYIVDHPQQLLDLALELHPQLLFKLERV
jgi:hypothetical protein